MRPELTRDTDPGTFRDFYWLKTELQAFCKEHGISASGAKAEIADRIETFLATGEVTRPVRTPRVGRRSAPPGELGLDTVITADHRCSQEVRAFFGSVIPRFHFSTFIQRYLRENAGRTYRDVVVAWHEEAGRKKDPSYQKDIAPQFEYNRFIRDFFADPANRGRSRQEGIEAWNRTKRLPGSNAYRP